MSSFSSTVHLLSVSHSRFIINKFVFAEKGFDFNLLFSRVRVSGVCVCLCIYIFYQRRRHRRCCRLFLLLIIFLTFVCHISRASFVCTLGNEHHFQFAFFWLRVCAFFLFLEFLSEEKNTHTDDDDRIWQKKHTQCKQIQILKWLRERARNNDDAKRGKKLLRDLGQMIRSWERQHTIKLHTHTHSKHTHRFLFLSPLLAHAVFLPFFLFFSFLLCTIKYAIFSHKNGREHDEYWIN